MHHDQLVRWHHYTYSSCCCCYWCSSLLLFQLHLSQIPFWFTCGDVHLIARARTTCAHARRTNNPVHHICTLLLHMLRRTRIKGCAHCSPSSFQNPSFYLITRRIFMITFFFFRHLQPKPSEQSGKCAIIRPLNSFDGVGLCGTHVPGP